MTAHPFPRSASGSQELKSRDGVWRAHSRDSHYCVIADEWAVSIILTFNAQCVQSSRTPDAQAENREYMVMVEEDTDVGSPEASWTPTLPSSCLSQSWRLLSTLQALPLQAGRVFHLGTGATK